MKTITKQSHSGNITSGFRAVIFLLAFLLQFKGFAQDERKSIHVGLVYPISNHGARAAEHTNVFSLHALAGVSRAECGIAISGFSSIITDNASGCQIAGFSNHIGQLAEGTTIAGFLNTYKSGNGAQLAGFANIATSDVSGAQVAGFVNTARDRHGLQIAGFANVAREVRGHQLAGFINTAGEVRGIQASGFINVARKVKGVQLSGFINIADSSDFPIGIINLSKDGEQRIGISTDDNLTTLLAFRSGGRVMYGIIGLGHNFKNEDDIYSLQVGIGAHLIDRRFFRLNAEATTVTLENFKRGSFNKYSLSLQPSFRIINAIEIFGGPALNVVSTDTSEGKKLVDNYMWNKTDRQNQLHGIYLGYVAGIHVRI